MTDSSKDQKVGLLLCDDLIFTSRVTGTGRDLGLTIQPARDVESLKQLARENRVTCVIVDLHCAGLDIAGLLGFLREECSPTPFVVGFGSHVAVDILKAARDAGCDLVLPRSKFVEELPSQLPRWLAERT